jgi:acetolactate synthase-1/2/3 large subunit
MNRRNFIARGQRLLAVAGARPAIDALPSATNTRVPHTSALNGSPIHPLRLAHELQPLLSNDMTLCLNMGSFHIWLARHLYSFRARQTLMTNGQQTLGAALAWVITACLVRPGEKAISISGDGGFLFSAMETEVQLSSLGLD